MRNNLLITLPIECIQERGYLFLWVVNCQIPFAFEFLKEKDYHYCFHITWEKLTKTGVTHYSLGYYGVYAKGIA